MDLSKFEIEKEYIKKVHNNCVYNKVILDYYSRMFLELNNPKKLIDVYKRIEGCNKFWQIDRYDYSQIKDFKRTNLCKDKFCNNCKKVKQACRMSRYIPELEVYKDSLYHITLTVPNVCGDDLDFTLKHMARSFKLLVRIFTGNYKLGFIDFTKYDYQGCVRSLEITFKDDEYHPHYHCGFVFKNLDLDKKYKNNYSIDYKKLREDKLFSEFEINLQKIWYMIYNCTPLTKKNFDKTDLGYSCNCDKFKENDYAQLFKYMTKETNENDSVLSYENFKVLYNSTRYLHQIQGYGCLYRITDIELETEVAEVYMSIQEFLMSAEEPVQTAEKPNHLLSDTDYKLISRKKIYQYLKELD